MMARTDIHIDAMLRHLGAAYDVVNKLGEARAAKIA
jgi:hypothetical protein